MKKAVSVCVAVLFFNVSCAHQAVINSSPSGAKVTINGEYKGKTPVLLSESSGAGKSYGLKIEKEGYNPLITTMIQDDWNVGATVTSVAGGFVCLLPFIGLMWARQLRDNYTFELEKAVPEANQIQDTQTK